MDVVTYPVHSGEEPIVMQRRGVKPKEPCPYCKKGETLLYDDTTANYVVIRNKRLYIRDDDEEFVSTEIKFCPMCGEKL